MIAITPDKIPLFASFDDAVNWWALRLRNEGFHVFCDGFTTEFAAAHMLERSARTLANWRSAGTGPSYRFRRGGRVAYSIQDVLSWDAGNS